MSLCYKKKTAFRSVHRQPEPLQCLSFLRILLASEYCLLEKYIRFVYRCFSIYKVKLPESHKRVQYISY